MATTPVIIAHMSSASESADALARDFKAMGIDAERLSIDQSTRPARAIKMRLAKIIVLWTQGAARNARLRALAAQARKRGALVLIRADASIPPAVLGSSHRLPQGRAASAAWGRILETQTMPEDISPMRTTRGAAVLALFMMALVPATASYFVDVSFAARIDTWAAQARALANGLIGG
jgi:hypothetical protein